FGPNLLRCRQDCHVLVTARPGESTVNTGLRPARAMAPALHFSRQRALHGFGAWFVVTVFTGTGVPLPKGFAHMPTHRSWIAGGFAALAVAGASPAFAQSLPAVTIGGGLQT